MVKDIVKCAEHKRPIAVSVVCTSFNQVSYIQDALNSFLDQNADFCYEIIVHDDHSCDGTAAIVDEYSRAHPKLITAILQTENKYSKGVSPLVETFKVANGKYIAICEGDDYWIDVNKLKIQFDFMESNPAVPFVCHNAFVEYIGSGERHLFNRTLSSGYYDAVSLMLKNWFIPTASLFIRKDIIPQNFPKWFGRVQSQDITLEIILALKGRFYYYERPMSIYRKNAIGSLSAKQTKPWGYLIKRIDLFWKIFFILPFKLKPLAIFDILRSCAKIMYAKFRIE